MALSRNVFVSRYHRLKAFALRQRPSDLAQRLRYDVESARGNGAVDPAAAWDVYKRFAKVECFADSGWLAQFGVYDWTGRPAFHFSLVRQIDCLEHWNDEYIQIELLLTHPTTPDLLALNSWNHWSMEHPTLAGFFAACEAHDDFRSVLAHTGTGWNWDVETHET